MLAGGVDRAGRVTANDARVIAAAEQYNLRVVDLTGVDDGSGNHHSKYSKSEAVMAAIGKGLRTGAAKSAAGVATAVTNVGTSIVKAPAAVFAVPE
jgi:esterase/lipase superfamily enzyme